MSEAIRYEVNALSTFVERLFENAGADAEVAQVVTRVLLEGELLGIIDPNHHSARTKHLFLQQLVLFQQQADICLEQLRLGLIALLPGTAQVLDTRVREQRLQAFVVAAQGAGVEHGLRRLISHVPAQLLDNSGEGRRANA